VTSAAERAIRSGHPWIFEGSVREQNRAGESGELAVIYNKENRFLAIGLYDPASPLRVRILHRGKPTTIDSVWWKARLAQALAKRAGLFDDNTTGYRCIHGENDAFPGLVLDRYDSTYVLKLYTAAWLPWLPQLEEVLLRELKPERIVLRFSRNIQEAAKEVGLEEGSVLSGPQFGGPIIFRENGLRFEADVIRGQKTGFFLDQRENRKEVEGLAAGRSVLNTFSFSGGFSVYAARGGAQSVTDVDISEHALASARRNFQLNAGTGAAPHECVQANAFEWLAQTGRKFDVVILDPPALAKRQSEREEAIKAYGRLISSGLQRLERGGILVAASCSAHVTEEEFLKVATDAIRTSGRRVEELSRTGQPPDHPATFKEARYLKCVFYREMKI